MHSAEINNRIKGALRCGGRTGQELVQKLLFGHTNTHTHIQLLHLGQKSCCNNVLTKNSQREYQQSRERMIYSVDVMAVPLADIGSRGLQ